MEAPEKLYLIQHNGLFCYCRNNKDDIEYIIKDAFIEKACEWLKRNTILAETTIERFKQTMEELNYGLRKELKKIEQKPAWREEDEEMLRDAIGAVGAADYYTYDDKHKIERWLNSLKERFKNGK